MPFIPFLSPLLRTMGKAPEVYAEPERPIEQPKERLVDAPKERAVKRAVAAPRALPSLSQSSYDRITRTSAAVVGLSLCAAAWVTGGYFTLAWIDGQGGHFARAGMLPIEVFIGTFITAAPNLPQMPALSAILIAWLAPLAITLGEIGFWPRRASGRVSRGIFLALAIFDIVTSFFGAQPLLAQRMSPDIAMVVAILLSAALALLPEKVARALWEENFA